MITNIRDLPVRDDVIVTISGTITGIREDEFLLQDSTGQIWVESANNRPFNVNIGEQVTVVGDRDDLEDFDAIQVNQNPVNPQIINPSAVPTPPNNNPQQGTPNNDNIIGDSNPNLINGFNGNDVILGEENNDILRGNQGQDTLIGGIGDDILLGGKGFDVLNGEEGNDILSGDIGQDLLTGGKGNDIFILTLQSASPNVEFADQILDFEIGVDKIQLNSELTLADLSLDTLANGTLIRVTQSNQILGIVNNITPELLNNSQNLF